MISSWTFFSLVDGEAIKSQYHQPIWGLLAYGQQTTSCIWWQFQYLQNSSNDMAQNIIYILEELQVLASLNG